MATKINTATELAEKMIDVAKNYKTLYVAGCFGAPMTEYNKDRYIKHCANYNGKPDRVAMIKSATDDTFGFDCVCLIKGLLWGWDGDKNEIYGGAIYCSNDVPDIDEDYMINLCEDVSTDFSKIEVGEAVWMKGHIGIYVGDGLVVECTPKWENKVQITACNCTKAGYNRRDWVKHGKLPYVSYSVENVENTKDSKFKEVNSMLTEAMAIIEKAKQTLQEFEEKMFEPYNVRITASVLNIRSGAGTGYNVVNAIQGNNSNEYTIIAEAEGDGATKWGLLKEYSERKNGWISLDYVKKI